MQYKEAVLNWKNPLRPALEALTSQHTSVQQTLAETSRALEAHRQESAAAQAEVQRLSATAAEQAQGHGAAHCMAPALYW